MSSLTTMNSPNLSDVIGKAMRKVKADKESDLCYYIPVEGNRIHHLSFTRMKLSNPKDLVCLLEKHILESDSPKMYPGKKRVPRSSNGKALNLKLQKSQAKELLRLARESGNEELVDLLKPVYSLKEVQNELIKSIREKKLDRELWKSYEVALTAPNQ